MLGITVTEIAKKSSLGTSEMYYQMFVVFRQNHFHSSQILLLSRAAECNSLTVCSFELVPQ